jgi:hypothetical protein
LDADARKRCRDGSTPARRRGASRERRARLARSARALLTLVLPESHVPSSQAGAVGRVARHQLGATPAQLGKGNGMKVQMSRWKGMDEDISDDQQDIARGRGMVDSKFQGGFGLGGTQVRLATPPPARDRTRRISRKSLRRGSRDGLFAASGTDGALRDRRDRARRISPESRSRTRTTRTRELARIETRAPRRALTVPSSPLRRRAHFVASPSRDRA